MKISVEVKDVSDEMFLHEVVGEIKSDDMSEAAEITRVVPDSSLLVRYKSRQYLVKTYDLVSAIMNEVISQ